MKTPVVDVVQIGAREHYAVPMMIDRLGMLRYFHTDLYAGQGSSIYTIASILRRFGSSSSLRQILERHAAIAAEKVRANNLIGLQGTAQLRRAKKVYEKTVVFHRFQNAIAEAAFKAASPAPEVFVGFRGSDRLFELARERSCCILDQIDGALHEVDIVKNEQNDFSDWMPDVDAPALSGVAQPSWLDLERPRLQKEWDLADAIVCNSDWTKQCLLESGVAAEKCIVVPLSYEAHGTRRKERRIPRRNSLTIGFLGSLMLRKGIHLLLEAARIASEEVEIRVLLAGTLDIRRDKLAQYARIADYQGIIPRGKVPAFLDRADVLALPSISEGFGIVQLEAMSQGLPVVTSDRTGNIVRDGIDGIVVPAKSVTALARAFVELARDPERLCSMSRAALDRSKQFSFEHVSAQWSDAIDFGVARHQLRR